MSQEALISANMEWRKVAAWKFAGWVSLLTLRGFHLGRLCDVTYTHRWYKVCASTRDLALPTQRVYCNKLHRTISAVENVHIHWICSAWFSGVLMCLHPLIWLYFRWKSSCPVLCLREWLWRTIPLDSLWPWIWRQQNKYYFMAFSHWKCVKGLLLLWGR